MWGSRNLNFDCLQWEKKGNDFFGELTSFRGGIAFRSGVTKDLTVGAGIVYDQSVIGLGELLYQPDKFPFSLSQSRKDSEGLYNRRFSCTNSPLGSFAP